MLLFLSWPIGVRCDDFLLTFELLGVTVVSERGARGSPHFCQHFVCLQDQLLPAKGFVTHSHTLPHSAEII